MPGEATIRLPVPENGRGAPIVAPESAGRQRPGGALVIEAHARPYTLELPDGSKRNLRAVTVTVVNRRKATQRRFADVTFAFQVRLEVRCASGLFPRSDMTGFGSRDPDAALADLHYAGVAEYAIGCNASAGWAADQDGVVRAAFTDFLPSAEVERVEPNEAIAGVEFEMETLAELAAGGADAVADALKDLPPLYEAWIAKQEAGIPGIAGAPRQATAKRLIASARQARDRIAAGVELLRADPHARARLPRDERSGRARGETARSHPERRRSRGATQAEMAAVPARLHPAQLCRGCRTRFTATARSSISCSSRPAAARPRPISASPPGRSRIGGSPIRARSARAWPS